MLKAKSEAKGITRNLIPNIGDITEFIVKGTSCLLDNLILNRALTILAIYAL